MPGSPRRLAAAGAVLAAAFATAHCRQGADTPPAAALDAAADATACCELTPNAQLREGIGRIVVSYPGDGAVAARIEVRAATDAGQRIGDAYGDASFELHPGTYDVLVGGRQVAGVGVQAGHDTRIRVGVLHVHAGEATHVDLLDPETGARMADGYGKRLYGLPIGQVTVEVARQRGTALVEDGKITDLRFGRVVVAYPERVSSPIEVFRSGEARRLADGYGDQAFDLLPGTYDVTISGKRVAGVTVRPGSNTPIEVGVLRVNASDGTHVEIADPISRQRLADGYGTQVFGLPIGEVAVRIAGQTETVLIEAGQVTDF